MKLIKRACIVAGLAALPLASGSSAMAQGCTGAGCSITGTITVGTALSLTSTLTNFTLTSANMGEGTGADTGTTFTVQSNDSSGYFVDIQGPSSFGPFPTADVSYATIGDQENLSLNLPATATNFFGSTNPSVGAGDVYNFGGFWLNTLPSDSGTGTGQVSFTLWGN